MRLKPYHPLSQGLLMSFILNENGGNMVYDASGNQNHGTGTNIAWGRDGLDLPGVNEHITIPNFIGQDDDWTIFLSFIQDTRNPTSQTADSILASMAAGTGTSRSIFYIDDGPGTPTNKLRSYVDGAPHTANTVIETGTSYTAGLTQNGTAFYFYLDGKPDGNFTAAASAANGDIILFDHAVATAQGCFDGTVGVFHWYDRPLTAPAMMWLDRDPWGMFEPDHTPSIIPAAGVIIPIVMNYYNQMARA